MVMFRRPNDGKLTLSDYMYGAVKAMGLAGYSNKEIIEVMRDCIDILLNEIVEELKDGSE